jgi:hypothetical protein
MVKQTRIIKEVANSAALFGSDQQLAKKKDGHRTHFRCLNPGRAKMGERESEVRRRGRFHMAAHESEVICFPFWK